MKNSEILLMLATGFEEVEAVTTADLLRRASLPVKTVSITGEKTVAGAHGIPVMADLLFEEADFTGAGMIVLPGGMPGTTNLRDFAPLRKQLLSFAAEGKKLAAICAAPLVFASCGILEGKQATIYSGMEEYLAGAILREDKVVIDGNLVTSKGPGTAMDFALTLIRLLAGEEAEEAVRQGLLYNPV